MEVSNWDDSKEERDEQRSVVQTATNTLLFPLRVAASPPLVRTYLRTLLLLIASVILFVFAVVAYTSLYYSYIPIRGISIPVYLQFDHGSAPQSFLGASSRQLEQQSQRWPHAVAGVQGLVKRQKYDISVEMTVPRSRTNLQAGNWMLDLSLRSPLASSNTIKNILGWDDDEAAPSSDKDDAAAALVLEHSRRPALLTYRSWPTEHLHRLLRLPLYLTGFGSESETLRIGMLESAYFASAVPSSLRLELRSTRPLEVYRVHVHISARLEGLRWLMYTHWIASAVVLVGLFWATEMGVLLLTWGVVAMLFGARSGHTDADADADADSEGKVKQDPDYASSATDVSSTAHQFPTLSSQPPLRYTSSDSQRLKKEQDGQEEGEERRLQDIPLALAGAEDAEADDEDDDFVLQEPGPWMGGAQGFADSGLGTGVESERDRERERVRRRGGRVKGEGGG